MSKTAAVQQSRAADTDVRHAVRNLERLLKLDPPAEITPLDQQTVDEISSCMETLQKLKGRLVRQGQLLSQLSQAEQELSRAPGVLDKRTEEIQAHTAIVHSRLSAVLDEKELLMRNLLVARRQLQRDDIISSSEDETDISSAGASSSQISPTCGPASLGTSSINPATSTLLGTAHWDDDLDDDDEQPTKDAKSPDQLAHGNVYQPSLAE